MRRWTMLDLSHDLPVAAADKDPAGEETKEQTDDGRDAQCDVEGIARRAAARFVPS